MRARRGVLRLVFVPCFGGSRCFELVVLLEIWECVRWRLSL